jgi:hypothetical protein
VAFRARDRGRWLTNGRALYGYARTWACPCMGMSIGTEADGRRTDAHTHARAHACAIRMNSTRCAQAHGRHTRRSTFGFVRPGAGEMQGGGSAIEGSLSRLVLSCMVSCVCAHAHCISCMRTECMRTRTLTHARTHTHTHTRTRTHTHIHTRMASHACAHNARTLCADGTRTHQHAVYAHTRMHACVRARTSTHTGVATT